MTRWENINNYFQLAFKSEQPLRVVFLNLRLHVTGYLWALCLLIGNAKLRKKCVSSSIETQKLHKTPSCAGINGTYRRQPEQPPSFLLKTTPGKLDDVYFHQKSAKSDWRRQKISYSAENHSLSTVYAKATPLKDRIRQVHLHIATASPKAYIIWIVSVTLDKILMKNFEGYHPDVFKSWKIRWNLNIQSGHLPLRPSSSAESLQPRIESYLSSIWNDKRYQKIP